jgi:hypothetical protein
MTRHLPQLFYRAVSRAAVFCLLLMNSAIGRAADIDLVSQPVSLDMVDQRFPWNETSLLTGSRIVQLPVKSQPALDAGDVEQVIDSDPCSGVTLTRNGQFSFLVNLNKISRLRMLVITGALKDATMSIKVSSEYLAPDAPGWRVLAENKPMQEPVSSLVFRPESVLQTIVTIRTGAQDADAAPSLNDISFLGERDVREFEFASKSRKREVSQNEGPQPAYSFASFSDVRHPESIFNVAGMYADARVAYISPSAPTENANALNDVNTDSTWTADPRKPEAVAILDLGGNRKMRRVSLVHSRYPGDLLCYAVKELPWDTAPAQKAVRLAWLPPTVGTFLADFPLLAQLDTPSVSPARNMQISSTLFDRMLRVGAVKTDNYNFTQFNVPASSEARYVILRQVNGATDSPIGFRINEVCALGNYTPADFTLAQRQLPQLDDRPLIALPGSVPTTPNVDVDPSNLGIVKSPPPASPSSP